MSKNNFNNQTEFVLSQDLAGGFTVLNNNILNSGLSYNAIGLYSTIIQKAYIPGWKVYQASLINAINKRASVKNGIDELIEFGLITKELLRNEKGQIKGVKYTICATPTRKKDYETGKWIGDVETVENTNVEPKAEKQISVKQTSVKQHLINKELKEIKNLKNKDKTTTKGKFENKDNKKTESKNSSSNKIKINLDLKNITKTNIKKLKLNQEQIDLLEEYVLNSACDDIDGFSYFIAKSIKNGEITRDSLKSKSHKVNKQVSSNKVTTFEETREKQLEDYNNAIEDDFNNLTL